METKKFEISWVSFWRVFLMLVLVASLYYIRDILVVLLLGIVISSALDAPLNFLGKRKIPRIIGLLFIVIAVFSIIAIIFYTVFPLIIIQIKELFSHLNEIESYLGGFLGISKVAKQLEFSINSISQSVFSGDFSFLSIVPRVFENIILTIAVLFISFYLALDRNGVEKFLRAILPLGYEDYAISVFHRARHKIGKWLEGQIILSFIVAIVTFLGLKIIGVNYSLLIGLIAGIFEIIPLVGPLIVGALAFLIAVSQSFALGIYAILLFMVIQQLENHLLVPMIMKKATGLHPVIVIFAILAGSQIAGFVGIILAVPVVVVFQELLEDYALRKYRQPTL